MGNSEGRQETTGISHPNGLRDSHTAAAQQQQQQ